MGFVEVRCGLGGDAIRFALLRGFCFKLLRLCVLSLGCCDIGLCLLWVFGGYLALLDWFCGGFGWGWVCGFVVCLGFLGV